MTGEEVAMLLWIFVPCVIFGFLFGEVWIHWRRERRLRRALSGYDWTVRR